MATMTTAPEVLPSRPQALVLDESKLRHTLVTHLARAVEQARAAVTDPDLVTGVHELRKAARRVRAIVELARELVARRDRRRMRDALRDARRVLGAARDHAVAA